MNQSNQSNQYQNTIHYVFMDGLPEKDSWVKAFDEALSVADTFTLARFKRAVEYKGEYENTKAFPQYVKLMGVPSLLHQTAKLKP